MTRRIVLPLALFLLVGMVVVGCNKPPTPTPTAKTLCGGCGQIKGSDVCCKDVALCAKCGQIKGSDVCCKPGAACGSAGLIYFVRLDPCQGASKGYHRRKDSRAKHCDANPHGTEPRRVAAEPFSYE